MGFNRPYAERSVLSYSTLIIIFSAVYSVVLDPVRNQACSGSMDGTVRIWSLHTGQPLFTLTGHTSLVGLLGLSPSHLVSAAADSTLRIWNADTGELSHTLAAHTGAITCFQHDEFKVLSGSDGTLKMWDIRDGTVVRDLLTGVQGVWQVVFEGRWCVAASNRNDSTVLDVWDFGLDRDDGWIGEPPAWIYDEDGTSEEEEDIVCVREVAGMDEDSQADLDAMDQDLIPSDTDSADIVDLETRLLDEDHDRNFMMDSDVDSPPRRGTRWAPPHSTSSASRSNPTVTVGRSTRGSRRSEGAASSRVATRNEAQRTVRTRQQRRRDP